MENFDTGKKDLLTSDNLLVGSQSGINWKAAGGWAKALGIILIVFLGIMILGVFAIVAFDASSRQMTVLLGDNYIAAIIIIVILILVVCGMLAINLLRFGSGISTGVNNMDQPAFEKSMIALKNYFIISGIISILGVLYTVLTLFK